MKKTARRAVAISGMTLAIGATLGAAPAFGFYAWQGDDYAYTTNGGRNAEVCDWEADGNKIKAQYRRDGSDTIKNWWNELGDGSCYPTPEGREINKMRVVEQRFAAPDVEGKWYYR
ncbi:hypothetical protein [Streptomyces pini]|uniref:Peptidase inhibitor family I36 n=1 Tax=Streptomyces pini TaxID=1520580 RepID=A0A1I3Z126_9ACTN|nr:hypothetical protein [Streptomyces pini]SFK37747.1 hypothetical protein SAMN05192584_105279 [Streptomyces pini]